MPKAEIISITTRRNAMMGGIVATVAGFIAPVIAMAAPSGPDAVLLDLCRQFDAEAFALRSHDDATAELKDDDLLPLLDSFADTMDQIIATRAMTGSGYRAKAGALHHALMHRVAVSTTESFEEQAEDYQLLAMSLARDLAAVPV